MTNSNKLSKQKEQLAIRTLQVAEDSLEIIQSTLDDCGIEDLIKIFNSSVKAHREFISDVSSMAEAESKSERELAKEYKGTAADFINRFKPQV